MDERTKVEEPLQHKNRPHHVPIVVAIVASVTVMLGLVAAGAPVLRNYKDALEAAQALLTVIGLLAGGIWFYHRRETFPRADLSHNLVHREIAPGVVWMRINAVLCNKGTVRINIKNTRLIINQIDPPSEKALSELPTSDRDRLVDWERLIQRDDSAKEDQNLTEIEPGETDVCKWDVQIPNTARVIAVWTFLRNETKRGAIPIGWGLTSIYDLTAPVHEAQRTSGLSARASSAAPSTAAPDQT